MHLFLITNTTQRELVLICTRREYATEINSLSLPYYSLESIDVFENIKENLYSVDIVLIVFNSVYVLHFSCKKTAS